MKRRYLQIDSLDLQRPILRDLLYKLLKVLQQLLWPLQSSKVTSSRMISPKHQISCRLHPTHRNRSKLKREPAVTQWLADLPLRVIVRTGVIWVEALAVWKD